MLSKVHAPHNTRRLLFFTLGLLGAVAIFATVARAQLPQPRPDGSRSPAAPLACSSPSFASAVNYSMPGSPYSVATGDFNLDGKPDMVTASNGSSDVKVRLGAAGGTFAGSFATFPTGSGPRAVVVADFNNNGSLDLTVADDNSNDVSVLLGTGTGSFGFAVTFPVGNRPRSLLAADFNGDGRQDLAVANFNSNNV